MKSVIRLFALMLAVMMCSCAGATTMQPPAPPKLVQHMTNATVALVIYIPTRDITHAYCSGVFVDETHIVTASHCMRGLAEMQARIQKILKKGPSDDDDEDEIIGANPVGLTVHYTLQNAIEAPGKEPTAIYLAK